MSDLRVPGYVRPVVIDATHGTVAVTVVRPAPPPPPPPPPPPSRIRIEIRCDDASKLMAWLGTTRGGELSDLYGALCGAGIEPIGTWNADGTWRD